MTDVSIEGGGPERKRRNGAVDSLGAAIRDVFGGLSRWRIAGMLASTDVRNRYRRSKFGQWWLTLSMGITIATLAFVYSTLFKIDLAVYLPYIAISLVIWALLSSLILEGGQTFIEAESYVKNVPLPLSVYTLRVLARNAIVFGHNLILIPIVMAIFLIWPTWHLLWLFPALILVFLNGYWIALLLGILCARFRDLPQILASGLQVTFFLSPVIWKPQQLANSIPWLAHYNPFAIFLSLVRDPIFGAAPSMHAWVYALVLTAVGMALTLLVFARLRGRVVYYL